MPEQAKPSCGGGCGQCSIGGRVPKPGELVGWRLGLAAAGMFLFPLALAVVGALAGRGSQTGQFLGSLAGLVVGAIVAAGVGRVLRRSFKEAA